MKSKSSRSSSSSELTAGDDDDDYIILLINSVVVDDEEEEELSTVSFAEMVRLFVSTVFHTTTVWLAVVQLTSQPATEWRQWKWFLFSYLHTNGHHLFVSIVMVRSADNKTNQITPTIEQQLHDVDGGGPKFIIIKIIPRSFKVYKRFAHDGMVNCLLACLPF